MLCKPKKRPRYRRIRRCICVILAVIVLLSVYLEFAVKSQLSDVIAAGTKILAQTAVNRTVISYLSKNPDIGERLSVVKYADSGAVTSVTADPTAVNSLKASISDLSQQAIESTSSSEGISLPLGSFSGFVLFANLGPEVRLDVACRSTVTCSLKSTFESAGINQTLHHVILSVDVEIVVYNPFRINAPIHTSADFEIAQTVIVGSVPSYALGSLISQ